MFKSRKEFEEALVKAVEEEVKKASKSNMEQDVDHHSPGIKGMSVNHGYHPSGGGTSMLEYDRADGKMAAHIRENVIKPLKAKGYHVEHENYDEDYKRVYVSPSKPK